MKKFLGVFVAIALCICMCASAVSAVDTSSITALIESLGIDLGDEGLTNGELSSILGNLNLEGFDVDSIKSALDSGDSNQLANIEDALLNLENNVGSGSLLGSGANDDSALGGLSDLLGGIDLSGITDSVSSGDALSSITGLFEGLDTSSFDISGLFDMISGAFSGGGLDLGSLTEGLDLGSFDITSILGGGDASGGATDTMSSIMDGLTSGLSSFGFDISSLSGLMDSDIVNFFANLFIGLGDIVSPSTDETPATTAAPSTSATTTAPAVVTTTTPNTGDTSAVVVALGTISIAAAAAFVCLKKKEN